MSNIFLINLSEDIINMWRRGNSGLMLSQDVLDKFNIRFCEQLVEYITLFVRKPLMNLNTGILPP